jgi:hypothetical protein
MRHDTLRDFVASFYEDVADALEAADEEPTDPQYRLGVRRLAKAFFDKLELFELAQMFPSLPTRDVDAWYAGREKR